jgi:hypothetical protein
METKSFLNSILKIVNSITFSTTTIFLTFSNLFCMGYGGNPYMDQAALQRQIESMNEEEYLGMLSEAFEGYKKASPEEKEAIAREFGMPVESMDQLASEISKEINNAMTETKSKKQPTLDKPQKSQPERKPQEETKESEEIKKTVGNIAEHINDAIKTFSMLQKKIINQDVREILIDSYKDSIPNIEMALYYLGTIRSHIENAAEGGRNIFEDKDISTIKNIASNIIESLQNIVVGIITPEAHNKQFSGSLYEKYDIKNKTKAELKKTIEEKISATEGKVKSISSDRSLDNKLKTRILHENEFLLEELEEDLNKVASKEFEKKSKQEIEDEKNYKKIIQENIVSIAKALSDLFEKQKIISSLEEFIKKYLPKDYEIGKKKEEQIKKQYDTEIRIKSQRSSTGSYQSESYQYKPQMDNRRYSQEGRGSEGYGGYQDYGYDNARYPWDDFDQKDNMRSERDGSEALGGGSGGGRASIMDKTPQELQAQPQSMTQQTAPIKGRTVKTEKEESKDNEEVEPTTLESIQTQLEALENSEKVKEIRNIQKETIDLIKSISNKDFTETYKLLELINEKEDAENEADKKDIEKQFKKQKKEEETKIEIDLVKEIHIQIAKSINSKNKIFKKGKTKNTEDPYLAILKALDSKLEEIFENKTNVNNIFDIQIKTAQEEQEEQEQAKTETQSDGEKKTLPLIEVEDFL